MRIWDVCIQINRRTMMIYAIEAMHRRSALKKARTLAREIGGKVTCVLGWNDVK